MACQRRLSCIDSQTQAAYVLRKHESRGSPSAQSHEWLDGAEKTLLINGYSTSYAWPAMLQDMLDEHSGGSRVYHVASALSEDRLLKRGSRLLEAKSMKEPWHGCCATSSANLLAC